MKKIKKKNSGENNNNEIIDEVNEDECTNLNP